MPQSDKPLICQRTCLSKSRDTLLEIQQQHIQNLIFKHGWTAPPWGNKMVTTYYWKSKNDVFCFYTDLRQSTRSTVKTGVICCCMLCHRPVRKSWIAAIRGSPFLGVTRLAFVWAEKKTAIMASTQFSMNKTYWKLSIKRATKMCECSRWCKLTQVTDEDQA